MERKPATLASFFVYNPLFGPTDETEHEKLLFYYPADVPLDQKLKYVGLSEALVNFSRYGSPFLSLVFSTTATALFHILFLNFL